MTPRQIQKAIDKLRLEEGDILIVKSLDVLNILIKMERPPGSPQCPVLYAPDGVDKLDRASLIALIEELDHPGEPEPNRIISTEEPIQ